MALPNLPQRIREFLVSNHGSAYCDVCIQTTLDLNWRQQVQLVTATFSTTEQFERKIGPCFVCNEVKQVTAQRRDGQLVLSLRRGQDLPLNRPFKATHFKPTFEYTNKLLEPISKSRP